ncbi:MAG: hypothetical protein Kow0080_04090 [Candidatus Promineifilaceae bacterium]
MTDPFENSQPFTYMAFLLRFWRENAATSWRVTAENPHTGQKYAFSTPDEFWAFILSELDEAGE